MLYFLPEILSFVCVPLQELLVNTSIQLVTKWVIIGILGTNRQSMKQKEWDLIITQQYSASLVFSSFLHSKTPFKMPMAP